MKALSTLFGALGLLMICGNLALAQEDFAEVRKSVTDLARDKNFAEATEILENFIAANPSNLQAIGLRQILAMNLIQANERDAAFAQVEKQIAETLSNADPAKNFNLGTGLITSISMVYRRAGKGDEVLPAIDRVIDWAKTDFDGHEFSPRRMAISSMLISKAQNLSPIDNAGALNLLKEEAVHVKSWLDQDPGEQQAAHGLALLSGLSRLVDADEQARIYDEAMNLVRDQVSSHPERFNLLTSAVGMATMRASSLMGDDPDAAQEALDAFKSFAEGITNENEQAQKALERPLASLASLESRIASARTLLKLVGQPAPAMDSEFWVNANGFDPESLKGKVVLLDFWAVWCGPCIATFPHLKHWQEAYGDEGLQVVGVTRKYNFTWDAEAKRAVRGEGEVSVEAETEMLENFIAHHELKHPSFVTPQESKMWSEYGVSGIPHAVVVDRKGNVRLIKVGSGDANAQAIEAMIKQCLSEK